MIRIILKQIAKKHACLDLVMFLLLKMLAKFSNAVPEDIARTQEIVNVFRDHMANFANILLGKKIPEMKIMIFSFCIEKK